MGGKFGKSIFGRAPSRTSVTEFWVCMGLTVHNSSKSEGSMMHDDAFFQCIFLHFFANIRRRATTPPSRWGTCPRRTRLLKIWRRRAGLAAPLAKKIGVSTLGNVPFDHSTRFHKLLLTQGAQHQKLIGNGQSSPRRFWHQAGTKLVRTGSTCTTTRGERLVGRTTLFGAFASRRGRAVHYDGAASFRRGLTARHDQTALVSAKYRARNLVWRFFGQGLPS